MDRTDLKTAILDARYIDLIDLAGAMAAEVDGAPEDEIAGPKAQALAAAMFRWAAREIEGDSA